MEGFLCPSRALKCYKGGGETVFSKMRQVRALGLEMGSPKWAHSGLGMAIRAWPTGPQKKHGAGQGSEPAGSCGPDLHRPAACSG